MDFKAAMKRFLMTALALSVAGCAGSRPKPPEVYAYNHRLSVADQFERIKIEDGIDAGEADILASIYFYRHLGLCGVNYPVIRKGRFWRAGTVVGYGAARRPDITVNAVTGEVRQRG